MEPSDDTTQPSANSPSGELTSSDNNLSIPVVPVPAAAPSATERAVAELVTRGREHGGEVTSGEVFAALRELTPDTGELAAIYSAIEAAGVSVQDELRDELEYEDRQRAEEESARRRGVEHRRPTTEFR